MNCAKAQRTLVDYVEGALSGRKERAVEAHVETCEHCRIELSRIRQLRQDIASVAAPEPDAEFWQEFDRKFARRLADEEAPAPRRARGQLWLALGAAAAAAACVVVWLTVRTTEPASTGQLRLAQETDTFENVNIDPNWAYDYGFYGGDISVADLSTEQTEQVEEDILLLSENDWSVASEDMVLDTVYEETIYDQIDDMTMDEMEEFLNDLQASGRA